ncbi:hypothetical protein AS156_18660 [Bradyrhizobium macuxiense]|uniref:Uncharacterized protein n=1 Tax=Bradyrhizobium macuxiense TaxID=1755647 RepID=A0A109JGM7_9BRAD|nr:hypothetical protein [Bradyrhizobium macuxiense]KWV48493.1 hypothetical protein AS156_18660 [Bradyrhizobium macuxiense]
MLRDERWTETQIGTASLQGAIDLVGRHVIVRKPPHVKHMGHQRLDIGAVQVARNDQRTGICGCQFLLQRFPLCFRYEIRLANDDPVRIAQLRTKLWPFGLDLGIKRVDDSYDAIEMK